MKLLSYERTLLAHYIMQCPAERGVIFAIAVNNPKVSGPLIAAYRALDAVL